MGKKVTANDIAIQLNCSKSVVSRALNDKYGVSHEMRSKVRIAAMEMGYEFKSMLKVKQISTISDVKNILIIVTKADLHDEQFYLKIIFNIEKSLSENKIDINLLILEKDEREEIFLRMKRIKPDGVIVIGLVAYDVVVAIISSGIPVVLVDTIYKNLLVDRISVNNYMGAYEAARYLIMCGHRKLAFFGIDNYSFGFDERYRGYNECIAAYLESEIKDKSVILTDYGNDIFTDIDNAADSLFLPVSDMPTGIICANDKMAFSLYEKARKMGISIPDDLSIVGFDNIEKCEWETPKLTSVNYPLNEIGTFAVDVILAKILLKRKTTSLTLFDTYLVKRESVKNLNNN